MSQYRRGELRGRGWEPDMVWLRVDACARAGASVYSHGSGVGLAGIL